MANARNVDANRVVNVAAIGITSQSGTPILSGYVGLWNNSGTPQLRTYGGADVVPGNSIINVPVLLAQCASGNIIGRVQPGYACRVLAVDLQAVQAPTTSGRTGSFQVGVGSGSCSGGVVAATVTNMSLGARVAGTAITGANTVGTSGEITITVAAAASGAFAEGQGNFSIRLGPPA